MRPGGEYKAKQTTTCKNKHVCSRQGKNAKHTAKDSGHWEGATRSQPGPGPGRCDQDYGGGPGESTQRQRSPLNTMLNTGHLSFLTSESWFCSIPKHAIASLPFSVN